MMCHPPNFSIETSSALGAGIRAYGVRDFATLCECVRVLPYGRVSATDDPLRVLREGKGTCSSKHRLLAAVAHDCGHPEIQLIVGIYEMSEANTPGVVTALERARVASIPEAHCYLSVNGERMDFTGLAVGTASPFEALISEHVVDPGRLGPIKLDLHNRALALWASRAGVSVETAWSIREACIAALARRGHATT